MKKKKPRTKAQRIAAIERAIRKFGDPHGKLKAALEILNK
jgi:hypothetical protein